MRCKIKGKYIEIEEKLENRWIGLRVEKKLKLSGIKEPHTRLKMLLTDRYPEIIYSLGLRQRQMFHHMEVLIFLAGTFKGNFASVKFQLVIEPLLNQFFKDILFYRKLFKEYKKEIKKKKEKIRDYLLEEFLKAFKKYEGENKPIIILLDLFLNTGDLYWSMIINEKISSIISPFINPINGVKKIVRRDEMICKELAELATDVVDSLYYRINSSS